MKKLGIVIFSITFILSLYALYAYGQPVWIFSWFITFAGALITMK